MKLVGSVLKEAVHSYSKISPNVQVLRVETEKEGGSYGFYRSERGWLENVCAMGSSRPML